MTVCYSILSAYPLSAYIPGINSNVGALATVVALLYLVSASITIIWVKRQRAFARLGMENSVKHGEKMIYYSALFLAAF